MIRFHPVKWPVLVYEMMGPNGEYATTTTTRPKAEEIARRKGFKVVSYFEPDGGRVWVR